MNECIFCNIVEKKEAHIIFEDESLIAFLKKNPCATGHVIIISKKHYNIIEQIPDLEIGNMFNISNKISTALFETLKIQGTNIIINNGVPAGQSVAHVSVNIIPRNESDSLNFQWQPKQLNEEEMSTVELMLKESSKSIGDFKKEEKKPLNMDKEVNEIEEKEDYMLRYMRRIP